MNQLTSDQTVEQTLRQMLRYAELHASRGNVDPTLDFLNEAIGYVVEVGGELPKETLNGIKEEMKRN